MYFSVETQVDQNGIVYGPYFCARYYGGNTVRKVTVDGRIRTVSFNLGCYMLVFV